MAIEQQSFGGLPFKAPDRPMPRHRPVEALRRFRRLVADKEDTEQVFHIIAALSGGHLRQRLAAVLATEEGRKAAERHESIIPFLDDHERLATFPEGSVGRAYLQFMQREGLTAAGLEAEQRKFKPVVHDDLLQWYADRSRDVHDLIHVFTGYSRGTLGELSNLAFTYGLNRGGFGDIFISVMGVLEMKRWFPKLPLFRVLKEAYDNGRAARRFDTMDFEGLFRMPLEEARAMLNIRPAPLYARTSAIITATEPGKMAAAPYAPVAAG